MSPPAEQPRDGPAPAADPAPVDPTSGRPSPAVDPTPDRPLSPEPGRLAGQAGRWLPWLALLLVLGVALTIGAGGGDGPPSAASRTASLASDVRCPTCEGLSAAESESPASLAIRQEIRRRVDAGESDEEIRAFLVSRYGRDILLTPAGSGVAALVWILPVAAVVLGGGGLILVLRRRSASQPLVPTDEDRRLVERARHA